MQSSLCMTCIPSSIQPHNSTRYASKVFSSRTTAIPSSSSVKLASLDIDPILLHSHTEILHRQHRSCLSTSTLPTTAVPTPLHTQLCRLLQFASSRAAGCTGTRSSKTTGSSARAHRRRIAQRIIRRRRIRSPDPTVLVRIGRDISDEFLRGQRQKSCERKRRGIRTCARRVRRRRGR